MTTNSAPNTSELERRALADRAFRVTHRVIDKTASSKGGSCVPIRIGTRIFLATAAHVIPENHNIIVVVKSAVRDHVDRFVARHVNSAADVGCLEVAPVDAESFGEFALTLEDLVPNVSTGREHSVLVVGYPGQHIFPLYDGPITESSGLRIYGCGGFTFRSYTLTKNDWPTQGLQRRPTKSDLFVAYDPEDYCLFLHPGNAGTPGQRIDRGPPDMGGVSGGGIWLERNEVGEGVWSPKLRLHGIQTSWMRQGEWLRGSSIGAWLDLVATHYPELRSEIEGATQK